MFTSSLMLIFCKGSLILLSFYFSICCHYKKKAAIKKTSCLFINNEKKDPVKGGGACMTLNKAICQFYKKIKYLALCTGKHALH